MEENAPKEGQEDLEKKQVSLEEREKLLKARLLAQKAERELQQKMKDCLKDVEELESKVKERQQIMSRDVSFTRTKPEVTYKPMRHNRESLHTLHQCQAEKQREIEALLQEKTRREEEYSSYRQDLESMRKQRN